MSAEECCTIRHSLAPPGRWYLFKYTVVERSFPTTRPRESCKESAARGRHAIYPLPIFREKVASRIFLVEAAAHAFHNCKRETIGLPKAGGHEWLLEIDYRKREMFVYACEAFSRVIALGSTLAARKRLLNALADMTDDHPPYTATTHHQARRQFSIASVDPNAEEEGREIKRQSSVRREQSHGHRVVNAVCSDQCAAREFFPQHVLFWILPGGHTTPGSAAYHSSTGHDALRP